MAYKQIFVPCISNSERCETETSFGAFEFQLVIRNCIRITQEYQMEMKLNRTISFKSVLMILIYSQKRKYHKEIQIS
jgi:hypothetical protein